MLAFGRQPLHAGVAAFARRTAECVYCYVMSTLPDSDFDLNELFQPAWAKEPSALKYAKYEGETERFDRRGDRDRRGPRPPRRDGPPGPRRDGNRPSGDQRGPPRPGGGAPRPEGERGRSFGGPRSDFRRGDFRDQRPPPAPLPEIDLSLRPDDKGVESLSRQIKMTGRAYPLFDIAQMILQKPERHAVIFNTKKNAGGQSAQPLLVCALDDTLWLSQDEAIDHVLKKHFGTFYQAERIATEPPKGKYTFVAQCSISGVILGPPNHHDYQNQLRKLHAERFSRMPFEEYKSRVRIVRDEEVVKKWVDDQSWKTDYICLNMPEPLRLDTLEAVEKHFRETHKENIIKPVDSYTLNGAAARALRSPELVRLVRSVWEDQRRFPLQIATVLSQQFAEHGLQFFKVNKTLTHVCVARPHFLDMTATPVSEGVKQIVDYIDANPKRTRRHLIETLAPSPAAPPLAVAGSEAAMEPQPDSAQPTPEQTAVISDLHWLIHQGHVIEFANGVLETAKRPLPKLEPKRPAAPAKAAAPAPAAAVGKAVAPEPVIEAVPAPTADILQTETAVVAEEAPAAGNEAAAVDILPSELPPAAPGNAE